jgi:hypothetical protein
MSLTKISGLGTKKFNKSFTVSAEEKNKIVGDSTELPVFKFSEIKSPETFSGQPSLMPLITKHS